MVMCILMLTLTRLGSLNALEQCRRRGFWRRHGVIGRVPKADQLGRFAAALPAREVRRQLAQVYRSLRRRKALSPASHDNLFTLVIDGHECMASYWRQCPKCLTRRIQKNTPRERTQYHHRLVMATLICKRFSLLLDVEMQQKGETEVEAAKRLLDRVLADYPRAFDVVLADGLYAQAPFFKKVRQAGKHVIAVLKDEQRELVTDAMALCKYTKPKLLNRPRRERTVWDIEELNSWRQVGMPVRVVRSEETVTLERQLGHTEQLQSHWLWVSTIPRAQLSTAQFVDIAHGRWRIENDAFNELLTYWHADHVYKHDENAMLVFWLMTMLAYNLFHAFYFLNVKPAVRHAVAKYVLAEAISGQLRTANLPAGLHES
jgi:hypothetical protein